MLLLLIKRKRQSQIWYLLTISFVFSSLAVHN